MTPETEMTKSYADEIEICSEDQRTTVSIDAEMEKRYPPNATIHRGDEGSTVHRLVRKMDRKLLPLLAVIYLLCYLDRGNIGEFSVSAMGRPWFVSTY
jgi:hypothetical protein